jgi:hypothetical protein
MVREAAAVMVAVVAAVVGSIGRLGMAQPTMGSVLVLGKGQLSLGSADDGNSLPTLEREAALLSVLVRPPALAAALLDDGCPNIPLAHLIRCFQPHTLL